MNNASFNLRFIIHLCVALHYWFALYYDNKKFVVDPKKVQYAGKLKYITTWNLYTQAIFFTLCLFNDVFGDDKGLKTKLGKIKDYFQATIAFPLALYVSIVFWSLYAIDRELIFPESVDEFVPRWLNHIMHTNIAVFAVLETSLSRCSYPSRFHGLAIILTIILSYFAWVFIIFTKVHHWAYPFLPKFSWPQKMLFFGSSILLIVAVYLVGELLNSVIFSGHSSQNEPLSAIGVKEKLQ